MTPDNAIAKFAEDERRKADVLRYFKCLTTQQILQNRQFLGLPIQNVFSLTGLTFWVNQNILVRRVNLLILKPKSFSHEPVVHNPGWRGFKTYGYKKRLNQD
jgi:hypothetical protein